MSKKSVTGKHKISHDQMVLKLHRSRKASGGWSGGGGGGGWQG